MSEVTFENVEVGDKLPPIEKEVTQEKINKFAVAGMDCNPVHTDPDWMKATKDLDVRFFTTIWDIEENVAHGMLMMSWMSSLVTNWVLEDGGFLSSIDATLRSPVLPDQTITCKGEVKEKHPVEAPEAAYERIPEDAENFEEISGNNFVLVEIKLETEDGETAATAEARVRLPG